MVTAHKPGTLHRLPRQPTVLLPRIVIAILAQTYLLKQRDLSDDMDDTGLSSFPKRATIGSLLPRTSRIPRIARLELLQNGPNKPPQNNCHTIDIEPRGLNGCGTGQS